MCLPPVPILRQIDPVHTPTSNFLKIHLSIILPYTSGSSKWSLSLRVPNENIVYIFDLLHWYYMSRPSPRFGHPDNNSCKGKAVPLQAWSGPESSRNLRFPDFMTTAQDGGKVVNLTHRPPLPPGNIPGTHFC